MYHVDVQTAQFLSHSSLCLVTSLFVYNLLIKAIDSQSCRHDKHLITYIDKIEDKIEAVIQ